VVAPTGRGYRSARCDGCGLRVELCICAKLPTFTIETRLHLTLHCQEVRKPSGTARLLRRLIPASEFSTYGDGRNAEQSAASHSAVHETRLLEPLPTLVLYPDLSAPTLNQVSQEVRGPVRLVVPDGTWVQTRRWRRRDSTWSTARVVRIDDQQTDYQLRRSESPERLCTFEAVAFALGHLESQQLASDLLVWFEFWKRKALASRVGGLPASIP